MLQLSPWLLSRAARLAHCRLFCFTHAGGSAADFLPWHTALAPNIALCAVQLPGRGTRMAEPALADLSSVLAGVEQAILEADDGLPFAFFGHSLGALLAFEVARSFHRRAERLPQHLFASGCSAPSACQLDPPLHRLSDDELLAHLQTYNGTPQTLHANRELLNLVLPTLRADFALVGEYAYRPQPTLPVPITLLAGRHDPHVRADDLAGWADETHAGCSLHWFDGDHFFIRPQAQAIQQHVAQTLTGNRCSSSQRKSTTWP
jgi:medium-chain acyl-[acyl-carrier-protein] hydrolase